MEIVTLQGKAPSLVRASEVTLCLRRKMPWIPLSLIAVPMM